VKPPISKAGIDNIALRGFWIGLTRLPDHYLLKMFSGGQRHVENPCTQGTGQHFTSQKRISGGTTAHAARGCSRSHSYIFTGLSIQATGRLLQGWRLLMLVASTALVAKGGKGSGGGRLGFIIYRRHSFKYQWHPAGDRIRGTLSPNFGEENLYNWGSVFHEFCHPLGEWHWTVLFRVPLNLPTLLAPPTPWAIASLVRS